MTDLNEMWAELERYQPYADKRGFGEAWKQMCQDRTGAAAVMVPWAAGEPVVAAYAATYAAYAAYAPESVENRWAHRAIQHIREAIAQEQT